MKRTYVFHPLLFTLYAILAPLANLLSEASFSGGKSILTIILLAVLLTSLLRFAIKDPLKSGLVASAMLLIVFSFGHLTRILNRAFNLDLLFISLLLLGLCFLALLVWVRWVLRGPSQQSIINTYLNVVGFILILFPIYQIYTQAKQSQNIAPLIQPYFQQVWEANGVTKLDRLFIQEDALKPDIYFIVLDGYTRSDVLDELFGYQNTQFLTELTRQGFYVAEQSKSNYAYTVFSIASALNMSHLNTLPEDLNLQLEEDQLRVLAKALSPMIQDSKVRQFLEEQGYTTVAIETGYDQTEIRNAAILLRSPKLAENQGEIGMQTAFDLMLLDSTLGGLYLKLRGEEYSPLAQSYDAHRERIRFALSNLSEAAGREGNYFVYAHILALHAPFVFGQNGEEIQSNNPFTLDDWYAGESWEPSMYSDQLIYVNKLLMAELEEILAKSETPPVIIIMGDHGTRIMPVENPSEEMQMKVFFPNLTAYYLPGISTGTVYPAISPVNAFRVVFNAYFDAGLPLLDDSSYLYEDIGNQGKFIRAEDLCPQCFP